MDKGDKFTAKKAKIIRPTQNDESLDSSLDEARIAKFLLRNPDFFLRHPEVFDSAQIPAGKQVRLGGRSVVDFNQALVDRLRTQYRDLQEKTNSLVAASRENQAILDAVHEAILLLLRTRSFDQFIDTLTIDLSFMMDLDCITLAIEELPASHNETQIRNGIFLVPKGFVDDILGPKVDKLLLPQTQGDESLYGPAAGLISSEALFRLCISDTTPPAILAFGSRHPGHFDASQGTEFLTFLVRAVEHMIYAWLHHRA